MKKNRIALWQLAGLVHPNIFDDKLVPLNYMDFYSKPTAKVYTANIYSIVTNQ